MTGYTGVGRGGRTAVHFALCFMMGVSPATKCRHNDKIVSNPCIEHGTIGSLFDIKVTIFMYGVKILDRLLGDPVDMVKVTKDFTGAENP
eukprot:scaffold19716_cov59-Cylindrotheca_fusiformis.AAC.2